MMQQGSSNFEDKTAGAVIQRISAAGRFFMVSLGNEKAYD